MFYDWRMDKKRRQRGRLHLFNIQILAQYDCAEKESGDDERFCFTPETRVFIPNPYSVNFSDILQAKIIFTIEIFVNSLYLLHASVFAWKFSIPIYIEYVGRPRRVFRYLSGQFGESRDLGSNVFERKRLSKCVFFREEIDFLSSKTRSFSMGEEP
jgi:hypothetical protein